MLPVQAVRKRGRIAVSFRVAGEGVHQNARIQHQTLRLGGSNAHGTCLDNTNCLTLWSAVPFAAVRSAAVAAAEQHPISSHQGCQVV
jgi:hypothetical protein